MGAHLNINNFDFEWWAKNYPEMCEPPYKEIQVEQAKNKKK